MHDVERSAAVSRANGDLKRSLKWKGHTRMQSKSRIYVVLLMLLFLCCSIIAPPLFPLLNVWSLARDLSLDDRSRWRVAAIVLSLHLIEYFEIAQMQNSAPRKTRRSIECAKFLGSEKKTNFPFEVRKSSKKHEKRWKSISYFGIYLLLSFFCCTAPHTLDTRLHSCCPSFFRSSVCLPISLFLLVCSSRALLCSHRVFLTSHTKKEKKKSKAKSSSKFKWSVRREVWEGRKHYFFPDFFLLCLFFDFLTRVLLSLHPAHSADDDGNPYTLRESSRVLMCNQAKWDA